MLSFAGFTAAVHVRHSSQICCLIKLFLFVLLCFFFVLLLCPLYILTSSNTDNTDNTNNNTITMISMLRNGGFQTQNCNKLSVNPNSQQQEMPQPKPLPQTRTLTQTLTQPQPQPQTQHYANRSMDANIVDVNANGDDGGDSNGIGNGPLVDHNNLPKSRIVAGSDYNTITTNYVVTDRKSIVGDNKAITYTNSRTGKRVNSGVNSGLNIGSDNAATENLCTRRNKRFILFSGGGVVKFVMGLSFPIDLGDKQRSLSHFYNLQLQYPPIMQPTYWWNFFNSSTFAARRQRRQLITDAKIKLHQHLKHDASREFVYTAIEQIYERNGIPGEACLLQAICEVSQLPFHIPSVWENKLEYLWHALLNAVLIPTVPNVAIKYLHASQAGRFGVDCQQAFNDCPQRVNAWLRNVAHTE